MAGWTICPSSKKRAITFTGITLLVLPKISDWISIPLTAVPKERLTSMSEIIAGFMICLRSFSGNPAFTDPVNSELKIRVG